MLSIFRKSAKPKSMHPHFEDTSINTSLTEEAIQLLLALEQRQERLEARIIGSQQAYQTLMLGLDLTQKQVMLDGLFPWRPVEAGCQLTLKYAMKDTMYVIEATVIEQWHHRSNTSIVVEMTDNYFSANRRFHERIYFPKNSRPECRLHLLGDSSITGELADLSNGGMRAILLGKNRKLVKGETVSQCEVHFNEQFSICCAAKVNNHRFYRSPNCHNIIGLEFQAMEQENQQQIYSMIYAADTFLNSQH